MENQKIESSQEKKDKIKIKLMLLTSVLAILIAYVMLFLSFKSNDKDMQAVNEKLTKEQSLNSSCSYTRDSLSQEIKELSLYKGLTRAMVNRDEATSPLKYKVGNFVYLKRDSSKVVISDIVIGGSKYEYYVKYKVLHKDNVSEEVIPELIY